MVILNSKYCDLEALIESLVESGEMDDYNCGALIMVDVAEGGDVIAVDEPAYRITDKNLIVVDVVYCENNTGRLERSWSLSLIYENVPDADFNPDNYIYFESGGDPIAAIYNYLELQERSKENE